MQHGHGHAPWLWTCSVDMDMHHGHLHAPWTWTCTMVMDMDMHHGHGHAPRTWTCTMDMYMQNGHGYRLSFHVRWRLLRKHIIFCQEQILSRAFVLGSDFSEAFSFMKLYEKKFRTVSRNETILNEILHAILFRETIRNDISHVFCFVKFAKFREI